MKFDNFKEAVQFRINESQDNYWIVDYWEAVTEMFTKDISETIIFIQNDCDDEEFFWLSEVFENIAEEAQSGEFIEALYLRFAKVTKDKYNQKGFKSSFMREHIDYDKYIENVGEEIEYARNKLVCADYGKIIR